MKIQSRVCDVAAVNSSCCLYSAGGPETHPDDWKEREAVRHGAAVFTNALPANAKRPLLHTESRAADVSS